MGKKIIIIGGGLAGVEAAYQISKRGITVDLYEMRPGTMTGAHSTGFLGELVCSNSLGSTQVTSASGLLK
ncbi:MAG: FAD-dependent oxidoreductase, partial [Acidobacteria bacterium]|nr:FAD-dependent oxidoreductase [Acidobacteriota bacterium]